jgi:hypothetical protein
MIDPIGSAWAKYNWASKHMERVEKSIERSLDPNLHSVSLKTEIEATEKGANVLVRAAGLPTIRTDLGLALGDVFQNLRAALDHLAWGLVKVGNNPRPEKPQRVYFPMAESWGSFKGQVDEWLPGVSGEYRRIIRRFQPYRRGDGPKAMRWLRNLSDTDKHRVLIPAIVNQASLDLTISSNWPLTSLEWIVKKPGSLHAGKPLLRAGLSRREADCEVNVDGTMAVYPSLGRGVPLTESLVLIRGTVFEILSAFDKRL